MRRGDIWLFDLDPVRGGEANKARPAIVVSNDGANQAATRRGSGVVTVVPLTTNTSTVRYGSTSDCDVCERSEMSC